MGAQYVTLPFHSAFRECFRERLRPLNIEMPYLIAIASWLHGLNTSLGTGFENISHILSVVISVNLPEHTKLRDKNDTGFSNENIIRDLKSGIRTCPI